VCVTRHYTGLALSRHFYLVNGTKAQSQPPPPKLRFRNPLTYLLRANYSTKTCRKAGGKNAGTTDTYIRCHRFHRSEMEHVRLHLRSDQNRGPATAKTPVRLPTILPEKTPTCQHQKTRKIHHPLNITAHRIVLLTISVCINSTSSRIFKKQ